METRPLQTPQVGMQVFMGEMRLMVDVTKVDDSGFEFWVMNGCWSGRFEDGNIRVHATGCNFPEAVEPVEVVSVTDEEFDDWYMGNSRRSDLIEDEIDENDEDPEIAF